MAGIGFELRYLWGKKDYISNIRAYFISALATMGPTILCIIMIISMQTLLCYMGGSYKDKDLFIATMVYAFAFSLIITGGFAIFSSRYISDCIYEKRFTKIIPSFFGMVFIILILVFLSGNIFLAGSSIEPFIKLISYIIFAELSIIWIQSVYLSALKEYMSITVIFATGVTLILLSILFILKILGFYPLASVLLSATIGFLFMLVFFTVKLCRTFESESFTLSECLEFLNKIVDYPELLAIGFLYYLGVYGHNFVFWLSEQGVLIAGTYLFSTLYDVPAFYAILTIIPSMVMFIVKVETSFYQKYRDYYLVIQSQGNIVDIKRAKEEMSATLTAELRYIFEVQFFISLTSIVIGMKILPLMGLSMLSVDIFCILCLGNMAYIFMYLIIIILLYFNDRKGALIISFIFCVSSILFSYITILVDASFYGYGFFIAAFISMVIALGRLSAYLKSIEYYTFIQKPLPATQGVNIFAKIYDWLTRLEGNKNA